MTQPIPLRQPADAFLRGWGILPGAPAVR